MLFHGREACGHESAHMRWIRTRLGEENDSGRHGRAISGRGIQRIAYGGEVIIALGRNRLKPAEADSNASTSLCTRKVACSRQYRGVGSESTMYARMINNSASHCFRVRWHLCTDAYEEELPWLHARTAVGRPLEYSLRSHLFPQLRRSRFPLRQRQNWC